MQQKANAIEAARAVLEREIEGLKALEHSLDETFTRAVDLLAGVKGRVIVSGMGKSGHIARKIAATMASTGTPAFFVHPGEASHGDLGMITKDDAVILLSNSGETAELGDIIYYTKRFAIPLIGIVRRKTSMLVEASECALILPEIPEASPIGNPPTTSTTMMLALGDALAIALLMQRGVTNEDLGVLHPGGKIGKQFTKVKDLMRVGEALPLVRNTSPMSDVLLEITRKSLGCAGVLDAGGKLIGIITDGDLRRHMDNNLTQMKAAEVMTRNPRTIGAEALAAEALGVMNAKNITSLFVLGNAVPQGIIHIHDILRAGIV